MSIVQIQQIQVTDAEIDASIRLEKLMSISKVTVPYWVTPLYVCVCTCVRVYVCTVMRGNDWLL